MFTGIIKEIGTVKSISKKGSAARIEIACSQVGQDLSLGDSVAVNGVCLSIVEKGGTLAFDAVGNTLNKTNLKRLRPGERVNLEEALRMGDSMGGHMVSGHIDAERTVKKSQDSSRGWILDIELLPADMAHIVPKGSITVDGVSLTIGEINRGFLRIYLIPHTLEQCTLGAKRPGNVVNIEFDMMGKYAKGKPPGNITMDSLRDKGFM